MAPLASTQAFQGADGQPLFYPPSIFVRNTFIDCNDMRPASLEEFIQERRVVSCPTSRVEDPGDGIDLALPCLPDPLLRSKTAGAIPSRRIAAEAVQDGTLGQEQEDGSSESECSTVDTAEAGARTSPMNPTQLPSSVRVLRLQDAIAAPLVADPWPQSGVVGEGQAVRSVSFAEPVSDQAASGSNGALASLPSVGSFGHDLGNCKPCAFFHAKGCSSGYDCHFCHICDAGEKKRRQKEKRAFFGSMRSLRQLASDNWLLGSAKNA
mmetsp:Transcript_40557/g.84903  ORF Transcript_40557/g.84903 Transcript_40557/m.84903 type:complete len:266 (+) Transcript_40557:89-886(+)